MLMKSLEIIEKLRGKNQGGILKKILISQLLIASRVQNLISSIDKTSYSYQMVSCEKIFEYSSA